MRVYSHKLTWTIVLLVTVGLLAACGSAETSQPTEPPKIEQPSEIPGGEEPTAPPSSIDSEALLQQRCTVCHSLSRVTSKMWSLQQWEQSVSDMIRKGAQLTSEEKDALVKYLAENYGP
jgi:cytochrome c5